MNRFPVLMYHRILSGLHPVDDPVERPWSVTLDAFTRQMDRLAAVGRVGVSMRRVHETLSAGGRVPAEWVAVTFDDGNASDHGHALPILAERGFNATFFICGNRVDAAGGLDRGQIREMHAAGMHVASHAMSHRFLTTLADAEEREEIARSREMLESIAGAPVDHFAPPGGRWSGRTAQTLRELSFAAVSTSAFGYNDAARCRFAYRRIPVVLETPEAQFDAIVAGTRTKLLASYARSAVGRVVRGTLGERVYGHLRRVTSGGGAS